jgi:hypothetical protein
MAAVLLTAVPTSAWSGSCAAAVQQAEQEIAFWPRCFESSGWRQAVMIRLRVAAQAAAAGREQLCWEQLRLSSYREDCHREADAARTPAR